MRRELISKGSLGKSARSGEAANGVVQEGGLEPPTSGSTDQRSNQLSYSCTLSRWAGKLGAKGCLGKEPPVVRPATHLGMGRAACAVGSADADNFELSGHEKPGPEARALPFRWRPQDAGA